MYLADKIYQTFPTPDIESMYLTTFTLLKTKHKTFKNKLGKLHFENKKLQEKQTSGKDLSEDTLVP